MRTLKAIYICITGVLILEFQTQIKLPEFYPVYTKCVNANWTCTCWGTLGKLFTKRGDSPKHNIL